MKPGNYKREIAAAKRVVLRVIAKGWTITKAAETARVNIRTVQRWKQKDPKFAKKFEDAYEAGTDLLEDRALELATGYDKAIVHKGEITGFTKQHSEMLLMFLLEPRLVKRYGHSCSSRELSRRYDGNNAARPLSQSEGEVTIIDPRETERDND